ncbi:MAG: hypothetical protein ACO3WU_09795 [Ilumatobacteraceae bacterium]
MERSVPGMCFLVAAVAIAIAAGSWWMQRIVFTPDSTRETAAAILSDPDIRLDINSLVSAASAPAIGRSVTEVSTEVEVSVLSTRAGAAMMGPIVESLHERVIGVRDEPVQITGSQMIDIVRDQAAADAPSITMPVDRIGTLNTIRIALTWSMLGALALAGLSILAGLVTRPERRDVVRGIGETALAVAAAMLVFGYFLPVHLVPSIDNQTWMGLVPRLALRTLRVGLGTSAVRAVVGGLALRAAAGAGRRRQWSSPGAASPTRYRAGRDAGWR